ncbi:Dimer-Tnp-hAT domain containing protein, partial [Pyrenophora tritici-repentis]
NSWVDKPEWLTSANAGFLQLWQSYKPQRTRPLSQTTAKPRHRGIDDVIGALVRRNKAQVEAAHDDEYERWRTQEPEWTSEQYLSDGHPVKYWIQLRSKYPCLSQFAIDILTIPASSCDCERLFSELGDLLEPRRRALGSELLAALQLVRSWRRAGFDGLYNNGDDEDKWSDVKDEEIVQQYDIEGWTGSPPKTNNGKEKAGGSKPPKTNNGKEKTGESSQSQKRGRAEDIQYPYGVKDLQDIDGEPKRIKLRNERLDGHLPLVATEWCEETDGRREWHLGMQYHPSSPVDSPPHVPINPVNIDLNTIPADSPDGNFDSIENSKTRCTHIPDRCRAWWKHAPDECWVVKSVQAPRPAIPDPILHPFEKIDLPQDFELSNRGRNIYQQRIVENAANDNDDTTPTLPVITVPGGVNRNAFKVHSLAAPLIPMLPGRAYGPYDDDSPASTDIDSDDDSDLFLASYQECSGIPPPPATTTGGSPTVPEAPGPVST